jgi:GNAT superfamily N-acetyltransferase
LSGTGENRANFGWSDFCFHTVPSLMSQSIRIRAATRSDCALLVELIRKLAEYQRLSDKCIVTEDQIEHQLFGAEPAAEAIVAEYNSGSGWKPEGFALFFRSFSTFLGTPGLYLEDLFVNTEVRGNGLGKALLMYLVETAKERGYARVEWSVLDWNRSAIAFYESLGALPLADSTIYRLSEATMDHLLTL